MRSSRPSTKIWKKIPCNSFEGSVRGRGVGLIVCHFVACRADECNVKASIATRTNDSSKQWKCRADLDRSLCEHDKSEGNSKYPGTKTSRAPCPRLPLHRGTRMTNEQYGDLVISGG